MAIAGLEVFNPNGTVRNTVTDFMGRVVGTKEVSGYGRMAWPYPDAVGKRTVIMYSNRTQGDAYYSVAYAYIHESGPYAGQIEYDIGGDRLPITLVFMVY